VSTAIYRQSKNSPTGEVFWTGHITPIHGEGFDVMAPAVSAFVDDAFLFESDVVALGMCSILGRCGPEKNAIWMARAVVVEHVVVKTEKTEA
jgi:hypothetical protein